MINRRLRCFAAILGAAFLLSFTNSGVSFQEVWTAPSDADTLKTPFTFSPQVVKEGQTLYAAYCVSCHGKSGLGDGSPGKFKVEPANFHSQRVKQQTDGALFWKLSNGRGISMPSFKAIFSEQQRWQLIAYIREFAKQDALPVSNSTSIRIANTSKYKFDAPTPGAYFPLPKKVSNVIRSEVQSFMIDTVVKGLSRPWSMLFLPDNRVLLAQRDGKLLQVRNGSLQNTAISGNIPKGLRDLKLHSNFQTNKLVYYSYYIDPIKPDGGYTVLARAKLAGDQLVDEQILYKSGPYRGNGEWYGSKIAFDKEGYVFFTVPINSDRKNAQNLAVADGKTLRFKDDGSIPADNPFIHTAGALPEIYSYGHRVHEGIALHPQTGHVFTTEFGELGGDELNVLKPGANYGWPVVSYSLEYNGAIISKSPFKEGMEPPVYHFAIAPSDVEFARGNRYPGWRDNVFIGGLAAKLLLRTNFKNNVPGHEERLLENIGRVRDVKFGPDNFLYVLTEDTGLMLRLIPVKL